MKALDPRLAAAIGKPVHAAYIAPAGNANAEHAYGLLGLTLDAGGVPVEVVVETDGGATFIPVRSLVALELEEAR